MMQMNNDEPNFRILIIDDNRAIHEALYKILGGEAATQQGPARIRGVGSHAPNERQSGHAEPIHEVARTFAEVEQALA